LRLLLAPCGIWQVRSGYVSGRVKPLVVAMSAFVLLAAPGLAGAGSPAATQYPNPTALIGAAPPSSSEPPGSTGLTTGTGTPAGTPANGHHGATPARAAFARRGRSRSRSSARAGRHGQGNPADGCTLGGRVRRGMCARRRLAHPAAL